MHMVKSAVLRRPSSVRRRGKSSVRPSVRPSVTLMYRGRVHWVSSKVITRIISLGSSLLGATAPAI